MTPKDEKTTPNRGLGDFLCFAVYSANLAFGRAYKPILDQARPDLPPVHRDRGAVGGGQPDRRQPGREAVPGIQHADAPAQEARGDGLCPPAARPPRTNARCVVSLTDAGRRLREKISTTSLVKASGLNPEEFRRMRKGVATLRDNLIKAGSE